MNYQDKAIEILLGLAITGICSAFWKLFQWLDKTDLRLHDIDRDLAHIKRQNQTLSQTVANLDLRDERMVKGFRRTLFSINGRMTRIEGRVYVAENRLSDGLTQAIAKQRDVMSERN